MAVIAGMTNSFKQEILEGVHDLASGADVIRIALYTSDADITPATTVYAATNEVSSATSSTTRACTTYSTKNVTLDSEDTTGINSGASVSGSGIVPGTTVASIDSSSALTLSVSASASEGDVTLTFGTDYDAGGATLTNNGLVQSGPTVYIDFADVAWDPMTFTVRGALIYNSTQSDKSIAVLDFGLDIAVSNATFTVKFPTADANDAIIRIK